MERLRSFQLGDRQDVERSLHTQDGVGGVTSVGVSGGCLLAARALIGR